LFDSNTQGRVPISISLQMLASGRAAGSTQFPHPVTDGWVSALQMWRKVPVGQVQRDPWEQHTA
jgi:hypothetical protein